MKKMLIFLTITLGIVSVLASCKNNFSGLDNDINSSHRKSEIAKNVGELKDAGYFDYLINECRAATDEESAQIMRFINDTDSVLEEICLEENGEEQISAINALFCEGSVDDFSNAFSKLDEEKSKEFIDFVNSNFNTESENAARSINMNSSILRLKYDTPAARGIFAADLEWSTIGWYTGFCVATTASFYLASFGPFWSRIAGQIAATAGVISMTVQLARWATCSDLLTFLQSLISVDPDDEDNIRSKTTTLNDIINSPEGKKVGLILLETAATAAASLITPKGRLLVSRIISAYNSLVETILSKLPKGIKYTIGSVPLEKVEKPAWLLKWALK